MVTNGYDGANRVNLVSGLLGGVTANYVSSMTYLPHGAPGSYMYGNTNINGNNLWPMFSYNKRLQPDTFYGLLGNPANQQFMYYFWHNWGGTNNNGNLLQVDERTGSGIAWASMTDFNQSFTYDNVNRLLTASEVTGGSTSWSRSFGYDAFGNSWVSALTGIGYGPATPAWNVYNGKNQIGSSPYDNAGNMTALPPSYTFTYDAENRQTSETNSQTPNATYSYDGDGRRVSKTVTGGGGPTVYVYDAFGQMAAEYSSAAAVAPVCQTCYLSYDHLGSVRMVTDGVATVIARHDYLPFGDEVPGGSFGRSSQWGAGTDNINQKFTGQERDTETNLDFFQARYYTLGIGRFMSPDPENASGNVGDPQSWNGYAYGRNNPLKNADPSGEKYQICDSSGKNCTSRDQELSDEELEGGKAAAKANGEHFRNGTMYHYASDGTQVVDGTYQRTDVDLSPFAARTLNRAGNMASPFVNGAGAGLMVFGSLVAPVPMAIAQCAAGDCDKGGVAMAVIPEVEALREGATLLRAGRGLHAAELLGKTGGFESALRDFESLPGKETIRGEVRVKTLSDSTKVDVRDFSSHGDAPTLEIIHPNGERTKYRY